MTLFLCLQICWMQNQSFYHNPLSLHCLLLSQLCKYSPWYEQDKRGRSQQGEAQTRCLGKFGERQLSDLACQNQSEVWSDFSIYQRHRVEGRCCASELQMFQREGLMSEVFLSCNLPVQGSSLWKLQVNSALKKCQICCSSNSWMTRKHAFHCCMESIKLKSGLEDATRGEIDGILWAMFCFWGVACSTDSGRFSS